MFLDRRMDFLDGHFPENRCNGYSQEFHIGPQETQEIKDVIDSHLRGCPVELAILSLVVLSVARVDGLPHVKFTIVHHGRDQPPGAADVMGFFTDFRTLVVPTSELNSLLGVISFVSASVRERSWRPPCSLEPIDTLVNIVPSTFEPVGSFTQARRPPWQSDGKLYQNKRMKTLRRPMELQIEQVGGEEWNITMYLDEQHFSLEKGERFRSCWLRILRDLRDNPFQGVLCSPNQKANM